MYSSGVHLRRLALSRSGSDLVMRWHEAELAVVDRKSFAHAVFKIEALPLDVMGAGRKQ